MRTTFVLSGLLCCGALVASAENLFLTGATVHTVSGQTFSPGQVLIRDNRIAGVGRTVPVAGAKTVDLMGLHLYPGLVALDTVLGLTEIEAVRGTLDTTEVGEYTPDVESWVAVNPDSELIPVARANGIACFQPVPEGGIVSGQSALMAVDGWTTEQMTFKKPIALHVFWPRLELDTTPKEEARDKTKWKSLEDQAQERGTKLQGMLDFFDEARAYGTARAASAANSGVAAPEQVPAWEAMLPYVSGSLPITVHADTVRQIKAAVAWGATNHYRLILAGAREAWQVADLLASNQVPVIYAHIFTKPLRDTESYDAYFAAPGVLSRAGVRVAFSLGLSAFEAPLARNLPYAAAQAVAFGLSEDEGLKGLTLYPAQMAGVADRLGSIELGKEATLVATDGPILDARANVKRMWVAGKEVSLETRHTRLYQKYKDRPR